jgi:hypothetical protein
MADPTYYSPYLPSDSELSDSDEEYQFTRASTPRPPNANQDFIDPRTAAPDFALLANALAVPLEPTAGPTLATQQQQQAYASQRLDQRVTYSSYSTAKDPKADQTAAEASGAPKYGKVTSAMKDTQTVIMLQSRDRDKGVYPQPTNCQLFLPRIYRNVQSFAVAQINLTSAFFYFRQDKGNVNILVYEKDTVLYSTDLTPTILTDASGNPRPLRLTRSLRDGSYNASQLMTEIQIQLNQTPIFYDFLNGFSDFLPLFQVNGDYSINFNYPGDYYYDAVRKIYISNPTRAQIVGFYFQSQFANQFTYTIEQVRVAYYYPVLKEAIVDPTTNLGSYNFSGTGLSTDDTIQYLLYSFGGISDPIASTVITNNVGLLDTYRLLHTFRYYLVNKYVASVDPANNRVTLASPSLNTSLVNLLNTQYNTYLAQQLSKYGLTPAQYNALAENNTKILSVLQSMYDYIQVDLAKYFAINYGTFSRAYFANMSNTVLIRNGLDASGIAIRYDNKVAPTPRDNDLMEDFRKPPPYYWNRMSNLGGTEGAQRNMGKTFQTYPTSSNFPYNLAASNIDLTRNFIDSNGNIYTDFRRNAGDILVNIDNAKYTIFKFRSKYRQTLQVETLPRQTPFRYPLYNQTHNVSYPLSNLYDVSYCYIAPSPSTFSKITYDVSYNALNGWSNLSNTNTYFGNTYANSEALWGNSNELINISSSNGRYYKLQTPLPVPLASKGSNVYTYQFNLTFTCTNSAGGIGQPFPSDFYAFFYHDIAAFNADISGVRLEQAIHYKKRVSVLSGTLSNTYTFTAYANQEYFIILRPVTLTPSSTNYRIIPWFPDGTAFSTLSYDTNFNPNANPETMLSNFNVAKNNDPNFVRLPVLPSTLWGPNPTDAVVNKPLGTNPPPIGYDISGVSNDLTDYIGFTAYNAISSINPLAKVRADPTNNYIFQSNTPYSVTAQSYFYPGSSNALLTSNADQPYTWKPIPNRQYKMLNYYATTYIPDVGTSSNYTAADVTPYVAPYTISTTSNTPLLGYAYQGSNQTLALGTGLCGWMFLPGTGTWSIDRITFKSNFITPSLSVNEQIHCLGVFYTSEILARPTSYIRLSNALAICLRTGSTTYTSGSLNIGFDAAQGTYYTFSNSPQLVVRSNAIISGFTQNAKVLINDPNTYYSIVAFTFPEYANQPWNLSNINIATLATQLTNANLVYIQNMTGSPIAYPFANQAYRSQSFYDGNHAPTGQDIVLSTSNGNNSIYGPPVGADESVSQYEQSLPYVNTNLHYLNPANIISDASGFTGWSNLPLQPTFVHASVPNYMLLQNGVFAIAKYTSYKTVTVNTPPARNFDLVGQVTIQQIFPDGDQTSLLAVSGDTHGYVFLGASNISATMSQLRFKRYDVASQTVSELPTNPAYTWSNSLLAQHFVWHNTGRWFLSSRSVPSNLVVLQGDTAYSSSNTMFTYDYANKQESELQMDPSGALLYLATMDTMATGFSNYSLFSFDSNDATGYVRNTSTGYTISLTSSNGSVPPSYKQMAVSLNTTIEEVLLINTDFAPYRFYKVRNYQPGLNTALSNANVDQSAMQFQNFQGNFIVPKRLIGGANGSKWAMFTDAPFLQGNRNDAFDAPIALDVAWQIFFPTMKIEMRKLTSGSSPMVDLTNLDYPEWPHTSMFAYNDYRKLVYDISSNGGQWGLERNSNFIVSDVSFNGFYFNSYTMNIPLQNNYSNTDSNDYYFVAVRGWAPTEKFQTMMRFYLPNRYDFGFVTLKDLSDEVIYASNTPIEVNPVYRANLLLFNNNFRFVNQSFGSNPTQGFTGSNITSVSFGDFMRQYYTYYTNFLSNSAILTEIQASLKNSINTFVTNDLKYILPDSALTRQRYTDPLLFQLLWKTELAPTRAALDDEWGLGWNLGFAKKDTGFATTFTATSFYKIQQDFIYLRLNPEFNINRMDAGGKENYRTTREPTGITNQYYCKLLLTSFGGNATTFIHNPISFNPPLARLTKLQFQWIDANGILINNDDSEWNMTVNITEKIETATIPDKMEYVPGGVQEPAPIPKELLAPKAQEEAKKEAIEELKRNPPEATQTGGIRRDFPPSLPAQWKATLRKEEDLPPAKDLNAIAANSYVNQFSPLTGNGSSEFADALAGLTTTIKIPKN